MVLSSQSASDPTHKGRTSMSPVTVGFAQVGRADVALVGGKGANLGEMTHAGFPVPPGFVVTSSAFLAATSRVTTHSSIASARCASAYGQRVIAYRKTQGLTEEPTIAVVVHDLERVADRRAHSGGLSGAHRRERAGPGPQSPALDHGGGAVSRVLAPALRPPRHPWCVDRLERPDTARPGRGP